MISNKSFPIELYLKTLDELELRRAELYEATKKAYPFDRTLLYQIEAAIAAKKSGKPLPLEVFQTC